MKKKPGHEDVLLPHLEEHLGPLRGGWTPKARLSFGVASFDDVPMRGAFTLVTTGVSSHILQQSGSDIRQELVFSCHDRFRGKNLEDVAARIADERIRSHRALLNGEVLGPAGPLFDGSTIEAFCCTSPRYFPEDFEVIETTTPIVVMVWLMPLTKSEARLAQKDGWEALEELFLKYDPDLLDLERPPVKGLGTK